MKKQITFVLLLILTAFTACKKNEGTHIDIVGKWQVSKIETTTAGSEPQTYTGTSSDYIEFRSNEGNEMVVTLNSISSIGSYFVLENDGLKFGYDGKAYSGNITTISATKLEFTATVDNATPATTVKYYLTK